MNKTYRKNIWRTIWNSKGRYFAIMAIIALGVGFFAGLKVTKPGMVKTGNTYLNEHSLFDFRLLSTYGFEQEEVDKMKEEEHVLAAEGSYYQDFVYVDEDGEEHVLKAFSITEDVNTLELCAGRMPEKDSECVLDAYQYPDSMIGKEIVIDKGNSEEILDSFKYDSYTVVGMVNSPIYINMERGTTNIGSGRVGGFIYLPIDGFEFEYYKEMYVKCQDNYDIYTDEYEEFIDSITEDIEASIQKIADERYDDLLVEIDEAYQEAVDEVHSEVEKEVRPLVEEAIREQTYTEVYEQVKQEMYNMLSNNGISDSQIWAMVGTDAFPVNETLVEQKVDELMEDELKATIEETVNLQVEEAAADIIADIEMPKFEEPETYVLDRFTNVGYMCYDNDTNIVEGVAKVFPIFFFLIAALVCSTTMTRMVDDERGQIGTFRAVGYSNGAIISKYLIYSGSSAFIGCVLGFFAGTWAFPYVISEAYRMLYDFGDGIEYYFSPGLLAICMIVSLICSMGTAYLACKNELRCMPADLIRPKAPVAGKRILLERIGFLWKPMKFLHKVTARNVFRFKKRMLMMILGIGGCTALVLTGLGVKDSVTNLAEFQYGEIDTHDIEVTFKDEITDKVVEEVNNLSSIKDNGNSFDMAKLYKTSVEYHTEDAIKTVYLVVANGADLDEFVHFNMNDKEVPYPAYGEVMITNKIADIAGIKVGDEITLTTSEDKNVTLTVSGIFSNYVWHYAYVTPETYEAYFDNDYEPNTMYINTGNDEISYEVGAELNEIDSVLAVSVVAEIKERVQNMMSMLNAVVWLVIGSAGALAFIVLFNLSNINITERVREIATIKVLGFYSGETGAYVFRENLVLTIMGIVVGLPLGVLLHSFVMAQIQVDMVAFATEIANISYFLTVIIVLIFLIIVDLVMRRKIEAIDMAESLKSIE